jgi:hypothetical protein
MTGGADFGRGPTRQPCICQTGAGGRTQSKDRRVHRELDWDDLSALQQAFQSHEGQATSQDLADHLARLSPGVRSMIYEVEDPNGIYSIDGP